MNDSMGGYVATETVKMMIKKGATIKGSRALVLGITFKRELSGYQKLQSN